MASFFQTEGREKKKSKKSGLLVEHLGIVIHNSPDASHKSMTCHRKLQFWPWTANTLQVNGVILSNRRQEKKIRIARRASWNCNSQFSRHKLQIDDNVIRNCILDREQQIRLQIYRAILTNRRQEKKFRIARRASLDIFSHNSPDGTPRSTRGHCRKLAV